MSVNPPKKCLFTLNVDNYSPQICEMTVPLFRQIAKKINADFYIIKDRRFPGFPAAYEKLQIYYLAQEMNLDWAWFLDIDAVVSPDIMDMTSIIPFDTVAHWGRDIASNRWRMDQFFLRDGRQISSCNWNTLASKWCLDLWHPLNDISLEEAVSNIFPINIELDKGIYSEHLIDDYTLSRNIAKYGLKFTTFREQFVKLGYAENAFVWHNYMLPLDQKIIETAKVLNAWKITDEFVRRYCKGENLTPGAPLPAIKLQGRKLVPQEVQICEQ
jgi:hypothetical protein